MIVAKTLTFYVARRFLAATAGMLLALTLLVSMFDFIELLRRAATRPDAGFALVASIAGLRMPFPNSLDEPTSDTTGVSGMLASSIMSGRVLQATSSALACWTTRRTPQMSRASMPPGPIWS